jgi:hypothetical protein
MFVSKSIYQFSFLFIHLLFCIRPTPSLPVTIYIVACSSHSGINSSDDDSGKDRDEQGDSSEDDEEVNDDTAARACLLNGVNNSNFLLFLFSFSY